VFGTLSTYSAARLSSSPLLQAWLRANSFWWNEDAIELGCSIDEEGAAHGHGSAPRVGVRARRRLDTGQCSANVSPSFHQLQWATDLTILRPSCHLSYARNLPVTHPPHTRPHAHDTSLIHPSLIHPSNTPHTPACAPLSYPPRPSPFTQGRWWCACRRRGA